MNNNNNNNTFLFHLSPNDPNIDIALGHPNVGVPGIDPPKSWHLLDSHGISMALIEIDGLPSYKNGQIFHGYVSHNQMVHFGKILCVADIVCIQKKIHV